VIGWSRSQATTPIFSISIKSPAATSPEYRPDIDGLRAIAVLAVCFYHANFSGFSGGYVGVDVFFVVSGFLIASFISSEMERGTFSLISFYERRIRRIFPALFNLALWTILAAFILLNPDDLRDFGNSLLAMTMFASNLFFSGQDHLRGYFGDLASQKPLLHTWSLAVEEQFYIFFPITMLALHRWSAKRQTLSIVFIVIFAVSLILGVGSTASNAEAAFFFLTPRVWEFMCGALLATISLPPLKHRLFREIAGVVGLALVCYAVTVFDKHTTFPGLNALFPCVGAALLIHAGAGGTSYIKRLLSLPPLVFVGVISYSLYLWHWPILVFAKLFLVRGLDNWETAAAIACALLAAFLSFEFVELPFRRKRSSIGRQQVFALGGIAGIICIFVGGAFVETGGLPQRYDIKTREIVLKNLERKKDGFWQCESWRTEVHTMSDMNFCEFGHTESNNVMFWGDSFLGMLGSMIKEAKSTGDLPDSGVILAIEPGCPVIPNVNNTSEVGYHCDDFNKFALQRADADDIGAVFLFSRDGG
jgi:peptidoglycan/LPS O-acetylase OafA/YrhL